MPKTEAERAEARRKFQELVDSLPPIEPCKHCGRCVMAGPPCCYEMAVDIGYKGDPDKWLDYYMKALDLE